MGRGGAEASNAKVLEVNTELPSLDIGAILPIIFVRQLASIAKRI